jgi:hypothetical protein
VSSAKVEFAHTALAELVHDLVVGNCLGDPGHTCLQKELAEMSDKKLIN